MRQKAATYPGDETKPHELLDLAREYHRAADALAALARKGQPLSRAPWRLAAIHAIELYLNAMLLQAGIELTAIRAMQHDLSARCDRALETGIVLRARTVAHLGSLTRDREYLLVRYTPGTHALSHVNRVDATLNEVAARANEVVEIPRIVRSSAGEAFSIRYACVRRNRSSDRTAS